jgi:hypothetical protein
MSISNQLTSRWEIDQLVKTRLFTDKQAVLRSALGGFISGPTSTQAANGHSYLCRGRD